MAISINKATNDLISLLKKQKSPDEPKKDYWTILNEQITEEGSWGDELLDTIKDEVSGWLGKLKKGDLKILWEESETAAENYDGKDMPDNETVVDELGEELLNSILNKIEDSTPREEYYIPEAGSSKKKFEDDDFEEDFNTDLFDDDDLDDFGDDYFDDDRY